ncbi:MAG: hypothetical protein QS721_08445 [Candidatus Endonucleobacter sp. (ex Gigantidas childressi)]|nr:hypothetical protein [Candidatus Endonucleobacter sp. (ex Gigantidas childressi)]
MLNNIINKIGSPFLNNLMNNGKVTNNTDKTSESFSTRFKWCAVGVVAAGTVVARLNPYVGSGMMALSAMAAIYSRYCSASMDVASTSLKSTPKTGLISAENDLHKRIMHEIDLKHGSFSSRTSGEYHTKLSKLVSGSQEMKDFKEMRYHDVALQRKITSELTEKENDRYNRNIGPLLAAYKNAATDIEMLKNEVSESNMEKLYKRREEKYYDQKVKCTNEEFRIAMKEVFEGKHGQKANTNASNAQKQVVTKLKKNPVELTIKLKADPIEAKEVCMTKTTKDADSFLLNLELNKKSLKVEKTKDGSISSKSPTSVQGTSDRLLEVMAIQGRRNSNSTKELIPDSKQMSQNAATFQAIVPENDILEAEAASSLDAMPIVSSDDITSWHEKILQTIENVPTLQTFACEDEVNIVAEAASPLDAMPIVSSDDITSTHEKILQTIENVPTLQTFACEDEVNIEAESFSQLSDMPIVSSDDITSTHDKILQTIENVPTLQTFACEDEVNIEAESFSQLSDMPIVSSDDITSTHDKILQTIENVPTLQTFACEDEVNIVAESVSQLSDMPIGVHLDPTESIFSKVTVSPVLETLQAEDVDSFAEKVNMIEKNSLPVHGIDGSEAEINRKERILPLHVRSTIHKRERLVVSDNLDKPLPSKAPAVSRSNVTDLRNMFRQKGIDAQNKSANTQKIDKLTPEAAKFETTKAFYHEHDSGIDISDTERKISELKADLLKLLEERESIHVKFGKLSTEKELILAELNDSNTSSYKLALNKAQKEQREMPAKHQEELEELKEKYDYLSEVVLEDAEKMQHYYGERNDLMTNYSIMEAAVENAVVTCKMTLKGAEDILDCAYNNIIVLDEQMNNLDKRLVSINTALNEKGNLCLHLQEDLTPPVADSESLLKADTAEQYRGLL